MKQINPIELLSLNLGGNKININTILPDIMQHMTKLQELNLYGNQYDECAELCKSLKFLTNLIILEIGPNIYEVSMHFLLVSLFNMNKLEKLSRYFIRFIFQRHQERSHTVID